MRFGLARFPAYLAVATIFIGSGRLAKAQSLGGPISLSGYGAPSGVGMGAGGPMIVIYGGMVDNVMPSRMGGGTSLSFGSDRGAAMGTGRPAFRLAPLSGGMSRNSRTPMSSALGGLRPGVFVVPRRSGSGSGLRDVMPPRISSPFRQPPSLIPDAASGAGLSM